MDFVGSLKAGRYTPLEWSGLICRAFRFWYHDFDELDSFYSDSLLHHGEAKDWDCRIGLNKRLSIPSSVKMDILATNA